MTSRYQQIGRTLHSSQRQHEWQYAVAARHPSRHLVGWNLLAFSLASTNTAREKIEQWSKLRRGKLWSEISSPIIWNHELLNEYFSLWNALQTVQINLSDEREDEIIWILEESGQYSASSAYNIQFAGQIPSNFPKINMASVGAAEIQSISMAAIARRTMDSSSPITTGLQEQLLLRTMWKEPRDGNTPIHWMSFFAKDLGAHNGTERVPEFEPLFFGSGEWYGWLVRPYDKPVQQDGTLAILALWCLWKQRNAVIFRDSRRTEQALFSEIKDTCSTWSLAGGKILRLLTVVQTSMSNQSWN